MLAANEIKPEWKRLNEWANLQWNEEWAIE